MKNMKDMKKRKTIMGLVSIVNGPRPILLHRLEFCRKQQRWLNKGRTRRCDGLYLKCEDFSFMIFMFFMVNAFGFSCLE